MGNIPSNISIIDLPDEIIYYLMMNYLIIPDKTGIYTNTLYNIFLTCSYFRSILSNGDMKKIKYHYTPNFVHRQRSIGKWFYEYQLPNGNIHGTYHHWKDGKLRRQGQCKNDKEVGYWETFGVKSGNIQFRKYYNYGIVIGLYLKYYNNGDVLMDCYYDRNEVRQLTFEQCYIDGAKLRALPYNNYYNLNHDYHSNGLVMNQYRHDITGQKIGLWISYDKSGNIRVKGCYLNDKKEGIWLIYNSDIVTKIECYENDQLVRTIHL